MSEKDKTEQSSIPTSKVSRAAKFVRTGMKVGSNYVKHYAKKTVTPGLEKDELHRENAKDIYAALGELKGSALKVAQMLSMDRNMLPTAYTDKFTAAQYSAPPLSYPLVVKTFRKNFGKSPDEIFDQFSKNAINAASIGQVHSAEKDGKKYAVKVQYPGVADSITSDLKMVKPFAVSMLKLNESDLEVYMKEVEQMLIAETDYDLELRRSQEISEACAGLPNLHFARYYPELSGPRILTMDLLEGEHLNVFLERNPSQEIRNKIGQALWDFYDFQMHDLLAVHADPHPGNFLLRLDGSVGVIDFGCVKTIPEDYYKIHFQIITPGLFEDEARLDRLFLALGFVFEDDTEEEKKFIGDVFRRMTALTRRPFENPEFDFADDDYFATLFAFGEEMSRSEAFRRSRRPRGSKDSLYLNRTYFGLYGILHDLRAKVNTHSRWFDKKISF